MVVAHRVFNFLSFLHINFLALCILLRPRPAAALGGTSFSRTGSTWQRSHEWAMAGLDLASLTMGDQLTLLSSCLMTGQGALLKSSLLNLLAESSRKHSSLTGFLPSL